MEKLNSFFGLGSCGLAKLDFGCVLTVINIVYTRNKVKCSCIHQEHGLDSLVLMRSSSSVIGAFPNCLRGQHEAERAKIQGYFAGRGEEDCKDCTIN